MKLVLNRQQIANITLIIACYFVVSCSSDDKAPDIYMNIPDSVFETLLIEKGIDSDGEINQQILRTDAKVVNTLDLNDLSKGEIKSLTGIKGFVNLKKLSVTRHAIDRVDLSANTLLDTLYLSGNYISSIDLSSNTNLILVDIQSNKLTSITGLSKAINLKDLDLSWNYFEEFSIHNKSLEVLHFSHNNLKSINTDGAVNLKNIFMPSNKLETVNFSTNTLLETLLISGNKLNHINLENNSKLTHLYISSNSLTNIDVSSNQKLVDLRVDRNPDLMCIKIESGQNISHISKSKYQKLSNNCN